MWLDDPRVGVWRTDEAAYPARAPFHPGRRYPEYPFDRVVANTENHAYDGVRQALKTLGLDREHFDTPEWNPLGDLVRPGDTVLLKPNWIRAPSSTERSTDCVITNGGVIRAAVDYVIIAQKGSGRIIIADGPQTDSDYEAILAHSGLNEVVRFLKAQGVAIETRDLRRDRWIMRGEVVERRVKLPGDPLGYSSIDLRGASAFVGYPLNGNFYGADYDVAETSQFHSDGRHEYVLCRTVMDADVVINIPKLKTHKKVGVTVSLKAMVGINGYRNCLPHHTSGTPRFGGDEFNRDILKDRLQSVGVLWFKHILLTLGGTGGLWARTLKRFGRWIFGDTSKVVRSGNWYGNDTAWRMVLDLNRAFFYYDGSGNKRDKPRRFLCIVDGIIGGEGNGPMLPDPVGAGIVVVGANPVAVDHVCATLMGFDVERIAMIRSAWNQHHQLPLVDYAPSAITVVSNVKEWRGDIDTLLGARHLGFRPHFGWVGHLERDPVTAILQEARHAPV